MILLKKTLPFHIHPVLWFLMGVSILTGSFMELSIVFFIILIHELGHYGMALFFRWRIRNLMLWPFGGVMETDEHGSRPFHEEALVIISGPLQHLWLYGFFYFISTTGVLADNLIALAFTYNTLILCFNLLPIWPLDGGKLLLLTMTYIMPYQKAQKVTLVVSLIMLVIACSTVFITSSFALSMYLLASFLIWENWIEWKQRHFAFIRYLMKRFQGSDEKVKHIHTLTVNPETLIYHTFTQFRRGCRHKIAVNHPIIGRVIIDEKECLHTYFSDKELNITAGELATRVAI